jgi:hypothetical protein
MFRPEGLIFTKERRNKKMNRDINKIWVIDIIQGPSIKSSHLDRKCRAELILIIDGYCGIIVAKKWFPKRTHGASETVLEDGIHTFGIPRKLYLNMNTSFCCQIENVCYNWGIDLIYPCLSEGRNFLKLDRFLRMVQDKFISSLDGVKDLKQLNNQFERWLERKHPKSIYTKPCAQKNSFRKNGGKNR